jgi:adenylate cyclase
LERKLAAILCADVYGYSRLMGDDEEATLRTLTSHRRLIDSSIERHHGRFVNSAGDSVLAEFASVVEAVNCAVAIQSGLKAENASLPSKRRMEFRIGVNLGDVMAEGEQIYGDGVNVAARLENLAEPGGICISGTVHDQVRDKLALGYADLGEQAVKNIARPVRVWRVLLDGAAPTRPASRRLPLRFRRAGLFSVVGLAIVIATIVIVQRVSLKPQQTQAAIPPQEKPALTLPDMPSIAVLPFTNLSGDPKQEYFSDGISDQLINSLSRLPGLFVIARNSSFSYKGKDIKEDQIGKELGVKYVLEGSVRKAADQVRIGVELVDASSGTEKWSEEYNRPLKDIFAVQDEIVGKVVTTLGLLLKLGGMKMLGLATRSTDNVEAFDDLLRAIDYYFRFTKDDNGKARRWFEKAVELDPQFAYAYAWLAGTYRLDVLFRWSEHPGVDLAKSSEFAQKALALDDSNAAALTVLCYVDFLQRRYDPAVADGERAVAINPNCAGCYEALSTALSGSDKPEEALAAAEKAVRLDPATRDFYGYFVAVPLVMMGRYHEAVPLLQRTLAVFPNQVWARAVLVVAYSELGRADDARREAAEVKRISPQFAMGEINKEASVNERWESDLRKAGLK